MAKGLKVGDTVAWHHTLAATAESVRRSTLPASHLPGEENGAPLATPVGTVKAVANEPGTWFEVEFEDGQTKVLTYEELVKVVEEGE